MEQSAKDKVCIVGVGHTKFGVMPGKTAFDMGALAFKAALEDAGLTKDDIDGLLVSRVPHYGRMADMLGLRHLRLINVLEAIGRMSGLAVQYAAAIINMGLAHTVALLYGNDGKSAGARYGGGAPRGTATYDAPYGWTSPGAAVGMMFRRHQHLFGTTAEQLAEVAINQRLNASLNPNAVLRDPIDLHDYMNGRFVAEPLRVFDYCMINDGGVALILSTAERAKHMRKDPVYISATAASSDNTNFYMSQDLYYTCLQDIAKNVYPVAGVDRQDVEVIQCYDNFTPTVLFALEGLGFCPRGEAGAWIQGGRIRRDGALPVNTSGSHTSEGYMQGWALHVEAVRQLRGECGPRQVKGRPLNVAQYVIPAPICQSHILTRR